MLTFYSDAHRQRDAQTELHDGQLVAPFESPKRADFVLAEVNKRGYEVRPESAFGLAPVKRVHRADYLDFLANCMDHWAAAGRTGEAIPDTWPSRSMDAKHIPRHIAGQIGYYALAGETSISQGTWEAAQLGVDVTLTATQAVIKGESAAFSLSRPPGHHASTDQFGGYCFLNNAAIAAQYWLDQGAKKVAILDVDYHHGNGTQKIFEASDQVFFASLHGDPAMTFPYFLGHTDEVGVGRGTGFNANYPLPHGCDYPTWRKALEKALAQIADFGPDGLVVSLGVDTYEADPISAFKLGSADFSDYGALISTLKLPTVFVLEGGYAVEAIGVNVANVLEGFQAGKS